MILMRVPHKNSGARLVIHGKDHWMYSGEDLVGFKTGTIKLRVATTGISETYRRHMTELGIMDWPSLPEKEFDREVSRLQ